jgi:hypothetical protein
MPEQTAPGAAPPSAVRHGEVLAPVDLPALAKQINSDHAAVISAAKSAVTRAISAGEALLTAKAAVPDGTWLRWLSANCTVSKRTAQLYMQLAENKLVLEAAARDQSATIADQTLNGAIKMLRGKSGRSAGGGSRDPVAKALQQKAFAILQMAWDQCSPTEQDIFRTKITVRRV